MFITFRCPCTRKLVVKQEFIGKRAVCPECGVKSVVPESSTEESAGRPAPRPVRPAAPAAEARTQVTARKRPVANEVPAPRRRPVADEDEAPRRRPVADEDEAPRRRPSTALTSTPRRRPVEAEADDEDEAPRPARRGSRKSRREAEGSGKVILIVAILGLVGLMLLGGVGFGIWYFVSSSPSKSSSSQARSPGDAKTIAPVASVIDKDLERMPDDAMGFFTVNAADFWNTETAKQLLQQMQQFQPEQNATEHLGFQLGDIRRATMFFGPDPDKQACMLISTSKPFQPDAVSKAVVPTGARVPYEGKSYMGDTNNALFLYPDNRSMLVGSVAGVHWLATATPGTDKGPLASARPLAGKHLVVGALNLEAPKIRQGMQAAPAEMKQKAGSLIQARVFTCTVDLLATQTRSRLSLKMPDEKVAVAALAEAKALHAQALQEMAKAKQQPGGAPMPPQAAQMIAQIESTVKNMNPTQSGDTVSVELVVDGNLGSGFQNLMQLGIPFPGAQPAQPGIKQPQPGIPPQPGIRQPPQPGVPQPGIKQPPQPGVNPPRVGFPTPVSRSNDLKILALAYHNFLNANGRAPLQPDDLAPFIENDQRLLNAMKSGEIVFIFGVTLQQMTAGTSTTVLAYEKTVPTNGGYVAFADGSVRMMTAEEFRKANLAGRK